MPTPAAFTHAFTVLMKFLTALLLASCFMQIVYSACLSCLSILYIGPADRLEFLRAKAATVFSSS